VAKDIFGNHKVNTAIIIVLAFMFVSVIYFPDRIWRHERELRDIARFRMEAINQGEKLFYILTEEYTTRPDILFHVVNASRDSALERLGDSNATFPETLRYVFPGKQLTIKYTPEYRQKYVEEHVALFKKLKPNHYFPPEQAKAFIETVKVYFDRGNFVGEQSVRLGKDSLRFTVPDKYDILYQNGKFRMFNVLTGSATEDPGFANPLVNAVLDSLERNPDLSGEVVFTGLYHEPITFSYTVPDNFSQLLERSKTQLKKFFKIDPLDSLAYGDTLYSIALEKFFTFDSIPEQFEITYRDTTGDTVIVNVPVDMEGMQDGLDKRRNTLYKALSGGYREPNPIIAQKIIDAVKDSLASDSVFIGTHKITLDLSEIPFKIRIDRTIPLNQIQINKDMYTRLEPWKIGVNLDSVAVEAVEYVADTLMKSRDFKDWQIYAAEGDSLNLFIPEDFLRMYDDMNLRLYKALTGEYTNIHDYAYNVIRKVEALAQQDSGSYFGEHVLDIPADTIVARVGSDYPEVYDSTFVVYKDTVVQLPDSSFYGVWFRLQRYAVPVEQPDTLPFVKAVDGQLYYNFHQADSTQDFMVFELRDKRHEKAFWGDNRYLVSFNNDSTLDAVFLLISDTTGADSALQASWKPFTVVSPEFVVGPEEKSLIMAKDSFYAWVDTVVALKYRKIQIKKPYKFANELKYCPVTGLPFRITVRYMVNLRIESPIEEKVTFRRYLFFTEVDTNHGYIQDGEPSWSK